jgi:hypothetical protein
MDDRLPAHLEVSALLRLVSASGGFATVIQKGERDAGAIMVLCCENGANTRAYERFPSLDGARKWHLVRSQDTENVTEFSDFLTRRADQDSDLWIVELDIANGERFIGLQDPAG